METPYLYCTAVGSLPSGSFTNVADAGGVYNGQWVQAVSRWVTTVYGKPEPLPERATKLQSWSVKNFPQFEGSFGAPLLKEERMPDYQAVLSSHEISKNIADLLEDIDPIQYNGSNRARRVRNVNDYIQGRNDMPLEPLLDWAAKADRGAYAGKWRCSASLSGTFKRKRPC